MWALLHIFLSPPNFPSITLVLKEGEEKRERKKKKTNKKKPMQNTPHTALPDAEVVRFAF